VVTYKKWSKTILRFTIIAALLCTLLASSVIAFASAPALADEGAGDETPVFPPAQPWFDWGQRYINKIVGVTAYTYQKGFGNYEQDLIIEGQPYKVNIALGPSMDVVYRAYQQADGDAEAWHWYMKGLWNPQLPLPGLIFDGEVLNFDYPLYLGKTWSDQTTFTHPVYGPLPVTTSAVVIAYVPPDIDEVSDIIVAEGYTYSIPDLNGNWIPGEDADALAVPQPLRELGDVSWNDMMSETDPYLDWEDVLVPAGPREGENVQGYYIVKQTLNVAGTITEMEAWKDVRGLVPVQVANGVTTTAYRWTGNFPWFEYEFGNHLRTFKFRVSDTAIGVGANTFQFTTRDRDYGVKYAGDAMTVDLERGRILIDYEDEYITCNGKMIRICDDNWVGYARIKDLETGRIYIAAGITMNR
jgi:hypothetical protein